MDPDPTPLFSDFKDAKKNFSYFFLVTFLQTHYSASFDSFADYFLEENFSTLIRGSATFLRG
jgi:hypothetical protein